jgi:hypothetical protein
MKTSSIATNEVARPKKEQFEMPTWGIIVTLIIAMVVLKSFIYIKDGSRHGK